MNIKAATYRLTLFSIHIREPIYHIVELFSQSAAEQMSLACFSQDSYARYIAFMGDAKRKHCFLSALL